MSFLTGDASFLSSSGSWQSEALLKLNGSVSEVFGVLLLTGASALLVCFYVDHFVEPPVVLLLFWQFVLCTGVSLLN
uniref:Uncharacterized protein n=1 Tax=Chenopodium quinoa TaxID=63459 RepID=A0A803MFK6_CHEQI